MIDSHYWGCLSCFWNLLFCYPEFFDIKVCFLSFGVLGPEELQLEIEKVICSNRESATASLDMKMKNKLTNKGSQISKKLLTKGLLKPFPKNCISVMTTTGAKGSTVSAVHFPCQKLNY